VATRQGLMAQSFRLAADAYRDAVGGSMSSDSLRRVTEEWGEQVDRQREEAAEQALSPVESPQERPVAEVAPIAGQANLSTDGGMVLIREEGWREVKLTAISEVEVRPAAERATGEKVSRRAQDPVVKLKGHSYQAGLWEADEMARHQYAEGVRREIDRCQRLSSVNDGAVWIQRITAFNFPTAVQIVDWRHAGERLLTVGQAVFGERSASGKEWVDHQLDSLWEGRVRSVERALEALNLDQEKWPDEVRQAPGYFSNNRKRMRYHEFRRAGYAIGSGTVESGINTVVHHRMRRPGRGWGRDTGQAMLAGLSEFHSGRFDRAWQATLPLAA
jgi:hypothetical protein